MTNKDSEIISFKSNVIGLSMYKGLSLSEAEDLFQDLYIRIHEKISSGKYKEEGKFKPWLMMIARNLIIDHYREKARIYKGYIRENLFRSGEYDTSIFNLVMDPALNVEERIVNEEELSRISRISEDLNPDFKEVLDMRLRDGLRFKEIAEKTDVSIMTAIGRMRYAITISKKNYYGR